MPEDRFPARLHVLLARESSTAVVIRRGPARQVCTIGWDRATDRFTLGQWLRGRIYERRSDLSPDGAYLVYFAMNGRWNTETRGSWTAISRAPYLKAIGLWGKGDCWHGGGLFAGKRDCWLNDGYGHTPLRVPPDIRLVERCPGPGGVGGECLSVYYARLLRDGWALTHATTRRKEASVFEKPAGAGWILRKSAHATIFAPRGRGCYYDTHALVHPQTGKTLPCPDWEWADMDGARVLWACAGCLYAARPGPGGLMEERQLYDFNEMRFEPIAAPY